MNQHPHRLPTALLCLALLFSACGSTPTPKKITQTLQQLAISTKIEAVQATPPASKP